MRNTLLVLALAAALLAGCAASKTASTENTEPQLVTSSADNYFVYNYNGRVYVIGQAKTNEKFLAHKHLPYTRTLLGAGPNGETVIFEVNKKDPALADRLVKTHRN